MCRQLRPRRKSVKVDWRTVVQDGYDRFDANVANFNDGNEDCTALIWYVDTDSRWHYIAGATGKGAGHAEMHALSQFVTNVCNGSVETFNEYKSYGSILVECEAKPCCRYCSAVLGLLGIGPKDSQTTKSPRRAGSTQWAIVSSLRTFLSDVTGYSVITFTSIDGTL
jgi:hypothetical protein